MTSHTDLLGDPPRLRATFEQQGYAYLKQALNPVVIDEVREAIEDVLIEEGFAVRAEDARSVRYSGKTDDRYGSLLPHWFAERLDSLGLTRRVMDEPSHRAVFEAVVGEEIEYLPITEYRARPPMDTPLKWHQDGFFNRGLELYTAWIPLIKIQGPLGGLAVAHGMHKGKYFHADYDPPGYLLPEDLVPEEGRRRADYEPGDVLIFDRRLPHTALPNVTKDSLRFSMDLRFHAASSTSKVMIGKIATSDDRSLTIESDVGGKVTLQVDEESQMRNWDGRPVALADVMESDLGHYEVMASQEAGRLMLIRPVTF